MSFSVCKSAFVFFALSIGSLFRWKWLFWNWKASVFLCQHNSIDSWENHSTSRIEIPASASNCTNWLPRRRRGKFREKLSHKTTALRDNFFFHPMTKGSVESEEVLLILKSVGQNRLQKSVGGYFRETVYLC